MITLERVLTRVVHAAINVLAVFGVIVVVGRLAVVANLSDVPISTIRQALLETAASSLADRAPPGGSFYVGSNEKDLDEKSMLLLQGRARGLHLQGISKRDTSADGCGHEQGIIPIGSCKIDNFVTVDYVTTILWRTIIVRTATAACGNELMLFRVFDKWYVISRVASCA